MTNSQELTEKLKDLKAQRKCGQIDEKEYYKGLLSLMRTLIEKLEGEDISAKDIRTQIPLIVLFITDQISEMEGRKH
jgi:hypothetical protein